MDELGSHSLQVKAFVTRLSRGLGEMSFTERHGPLRLPAGEAIYDDGNATTKTIFHLEDGQFHLTRLDSQRSGV